MKKIILSLLIFFIPFLVSADTEFSLEKTNLIDGVFEAKMSIDDNVLVGKSVLLDASESILLEDSKKTPSYVWTINGDKKIGPEHVISFDKVGKQVITLEIKQDQETDEVTKSVFVFDKKVLFITDGNNINYTGLKSQAEEVGVWFNLLNVKEEVTDFLSEDKLNSLYNENYEFIKNAEAIIFNTDNLDSFSVFVRYFKSLKDEKIFSLQDKQFIQLTNGNLNFKKSIINQHRKNLELENVLLTRVEAINPLFEMLDTSKVLNVLKSRAIEYILIDDTLKKNSWLVFSRVLAFFLSVGIPTNTIYLLLIFPFIALVVTFFRQVVGISSFGVYLPTMLALSFFVLGSQIAFMVIALVGILNVLIRFLLNKIDIMYIPKVALTLSGSALSLFIVIWLSVEMESSMIIPISIFPMLIISTLSERFVASQSQYGLKYALIGTLETVFIAFISYLITSLGPIYNLLLAYPELVILPFIFIIILGRFTGLRLSEYIKFRSLLSEGIQE